MGKMRQFRRAIRSASGKAVLFDLQSGYGSMLAQTFIRMGRGEKVSDAEILEMMGGGHSALSGDDDEADVKLVSAFAGPQMIPGGPGGKATAVVSCRGVAMYDIECQPYCFSTMLLAQTMNGLANDPQVGTILLDIDSPGGMVTGTAEAGDAIYQARRRKKVVALVNPLAASAAYWLASQASEIVAIPSGDIGSIGVFMTHVECSKAYDEAGIKITYIYAGEYKVEGNSTEPLAASAKEFYQGEVDDIYTAFLKAVARGRGTTVKNVFDNFGKGRCYSAPQAKAVGMIDDFMAIGDALTHWGIAQGGGDESRRGRRSEAGEPQQVAQAQAAEDPSSEAEEAASEQQTEAPSADRDAGSADGGEKTEGAVADADGCEAIVFRQAEADGVTSVYAVGPWPAKAKITDEAIEAPGIFRGGNSVAIVVSNGHAIYEQASYDANQKLGIYTLRADWAYTPPPQTEEEIAASAKAEEDEQERLANEAFLAEVEIFEHV